MKSHSVLAGGLLTAALLLALPGNGEARGLFQRDCCPPPPPVPIVLKVCHPCTGCMLDVPVCIPACCTGAPCVSNHCTLIGHGKTVFSWSCGHSVTVRFTHGGGYRVIQRG